MFIDFPYPGIKGIELPDSKVVRVYQPMICKKRFSDEEIIKKALVNPIATPRLKNLAGSKRNALILSDDISRPTPTDKILPYLLEELTEGGIKIEDIKILIALGTHRAMTEKEILEKFGSQIVSTVEIVNHAWFDQAQMSYYGRANGGTEVWGNRLLKNADLIIGVGHIVPHADLGFSGGGKIVVPGVCDERTTSHTHWILKNYDFSELFGKRNNPIRKMTDRIAREVGLDVIVNAVQYPAGELAALVIGDMVQSHIKGCKISKQIYGVKIKIKADIVIVDSYPADIDLRQAIKGLMAASLIVKEGGVIILVTTCPDGVAPQFPEYLDYGFKDPEKVERLAEKGVIKSKVGASTLICIGRILKYKAKGILVSTGLDRKTTEKMGFIYAADVKEAVEKAWHIKGKGAQISVLRHGGEALPLLQER